ncbi:MAG: hypothetical protein P8M25_04545, partial [Paracoccaceae bacterium]|nr:hypothetical protein [Paracoccaceae bacterium]
MRFVKHLFLCCGLGVLAGPVVADCLALSPDQRLSNHCLLVRVKNISMSPKFAQLLHHRLQQEGYRSVVHADQGTTSGNLRRSITPVIAYAQNVNGGNPDRTYIGGGITDPALVGKDGLLFGAAIGGDGRKIYGPGHYIDYAVQGSYTQSPTHAVTVKMVSAKVCTKHNVRNNLNIDLCGNDQQVWKKITKDHYRDLSLSANKLITYKNLTHHSLSLGTQFARYDANSQKQLFASLSTIYPRGRFSNLTATFGEPVAGKLAIQHAFNASLNTMVFNRPMSATASYTLMKGGKEKALQNLNIVTLDRSDHSAMIGLAYQVTPQLSNSLRYTRTN